MTKLTFSSVLILVFSFCHVSMNGLSFSPLRCWLSSQFPQDLLVSYVTTVAFPFLVVLFNTCMVCLVTFKLWGLRKRSRGNGSSTGWKKMNKENWARLWKDGSTVLGLSCVLGLPWGLSSVTYVSLPGIYVFTVLNALQGEREHTSYQRESSGSG